MVPIRSNLQDGESSISDLYVDYKGVRVWTSMQEDPNGQFGNADNTYGLIQDRAIDELPPTTPN